MLKYNPLEVASMEAFIAQCLNRGIDFIDKRATFFKGIDFKPSIDSKRVKVGLCQRIEWHVTFLSHSTLKLYSPEFRWCVICVGPGLINLLNTFLSLLLG